MPGALSFKIEVFHENVAVLPELQAKVRNLTALFEQIIGEWARGNAEKFGLGEGKSMTGAEIDPTVSWKALSPEYLKAKNQHYPDQLMVRTGALRNALTSPDGFFRMVEPEQALFGTPNDPDDVMKMQYNWKTRQVLFLSDFDQNMIREKTQKFFTVQTKSLKSDIADMNMSFENAVSE